MRTGAPEAPARVAAYSGHQAEQEPRSFSVEGREARVVSILEQWYEPDSRCFEVAASDGGTYLLRYDLNRLAWTAAVLPAGPRPRRPQP